MNPDEMLAYTGVVAWRTRRIARGGRSRSGVAPVSGEWQAHGGKAGHNVTTPTWGLVLQIGLWGCALWFVRARAAWEADLPALARVRCWGSRFVASYLLVLVVRLLVALLPSSIPAPVVVVLLLFLNSLALVLLLGVLVCLVLAWVCLVRDWRQRKGPLARSRELAEDALLLGHTQALAGGTEDELLAEIAGICQEEGWARESAEAQRFERLARAAYQARWREYYGNEEAESS